MGAWGVRAFDNDNANDWASRFVAGNDLALIEAAFRDVEQANPRNIPQAVACRALAACEVLARLLGNAGYTNAYTRKVDSWVAAHPRPLSAELLARANAVIARVLSTGSELRQLAGADWCVAVADLLSRLTVLRE